MAGLGGGGRSREYGERGKERDIIYLFIYLFLKYNMWRAVCSVYVVALVVNLTGWKDILGSCLMVVFGVDNLYWREVG